MSALLRRLSAVIRSYADFARSPTYFPLWLSQLVSTFGDRLHYFALVVLGFELTSGTRTCILVSPAS